MKDAGGKGLLSIVIITKETKDLLGDLLRSIEEDVSLMPFLAQVTIVDNGSSDGTDAMVREDFPTVALLRNETNRGFAASANAGFSLSSGKFILFLNSDTRLIPGEVQKMLAYMEESPSAAICGPQLVYPDLRPQRSAARTPSLLREIVPGSLLDLISPRVYGKGTRSLPAEPSSADQGRQAAVSAWDVDSLIGAAIMARREALERVGGFDERFFFFLEETDLCMKMRDAGYRVVLLPEIRVIHLQGKTVRRNWVQGRMEYNISMYKFIRKHHPAIYYRLFQAVRLTKCAAFVAVLTVLPFLLAGQRTRRTYGYYTRLLRWHLAGCPEGAGLRPS